MSMYLFSPQTNRAVKKKKMCLAHKERKYLLTKWINKMDSMGKLRVIFIVLLLY